MSKAAIRTAPGTVTVRVPLAFQRRGGRKLVIAPGGGTTLVAPRVRIDSTLVKALARAHRWKRMLESGQFASVADLARAERINKSYLCRVLRLTLLAPDIVEAIVDGRQPATLQLPQFMTLLPINWAEQRHTVQRAAAQQPHAERRMHLEFGDHLSRFG